MESKAKVLGHPIHPILIVFPLGLWPTAFVFDIMTAVGGNPQWSMAAFWMIAAGIATALAAAVFGLIDWLAIPTNSRARMVGAVHGVGNVIVTGLFVLAWLLRRETPAEPGWLALSLEAGAIALAVVTGWLGGDLVTRFGVSVEPGANVNAGGPLVGERSREDKARGDSEAAPAQPLPR